MGQKTVNLLTDHQGPLLSLVAALERAVARSVLSRRPTWPQRALAPIRERVLRDTVERYRTQTHALCLGLQKGHAPARTQLVALVDEAFANLRAGVREEARRRGLFLGFLAQRDARFAACEALEIGDDPKRGADLRIGTMIILHAFVRDVVGYDRFVDLLLPLANGRGPTRILDLAAGHGGFAIFTSLAARSRGIDLRFTATDLRKEYLDLGLATAKREGLPVDFRIQDALDLGNLEPGSQDIVVCTHALHHFSAGQIAVMLVEAARVAKRGVVFIDGNRSLLTALGFLLFSLIGSRNRFACYDGWVSARKFYVPEELALISRLTSREGQVSCRFLPPGYCVVSLDHQAGQGPPGAF